MLCGEVKQVTISLENVGKLPVNRVLFVSSENGLFAVPSCKSGSDVFTLPCGVIEPGRSKDVNIFIRACDISGRISVDLLFYYDCVKSSQQHGVKYRLIYHTMHLLIHESLLSSVTAVRSHVIADKDSVNFKVQVENRNQVRKRGRTLLCQSILTLFQRTLSRDFQITFCTVHYRCTIRIK